MDKLVKKLQTALKLGGFNVRREFCNLIINNFIEQHIDLSNNHLFDECIKNLCQSLESQCLSERSIEKEHIEQAIEVCLHFGYDKNETIFSVINAFNIPKLAYNLDRKLFFYDPKKPKLLADADSKALMFLDRYHSILQRTKRNFLTKGGEDGLSIKTVDYLLTLSSVTLDRTLILGSLLQVSEGKYYLEDPTGIVQLDLKHAKYYGGFFFEGCFVLVNGKYEDKILQVSTIILPPGEEYKDSKLSFGNLNYFGGPSSTPLKDSIRLREHLHKNPNEIILFFSDLWLDHPLIFEKLQILFEGLHDSPPIAFIFMGNFLSESNCSEMMETLKKLFKRLGDLIVKYPNLVSRSQFVFIPGFTDPCTPYVIPRFALPAFVTEELRRNVHKAVFATNPCRIQYCTKEIVVFRADLLSKFLQQSIHKPKKEELPENLTRTVISQGHLVPFTLNVMPVHWDFDYTLRLYPLPDLVVIGDRTEMYQEKYKQCHVVNPGPFCSSNFQFKSYIPGLNQIEDCSL